MRLNRCIAWASTVALAACGSLPPVESSRSDPGLVLRGTVVTMNDAGEVLADGRLWIRAGHIEAIWRASDPLPDSAKGAREVWVGGLIYPGLIDVHNHPDYAAYPMMRITKRYSDRYEWRYYDGTYARRITNPHMVVGSADFFGLGNELGRYGELMALAGGTTSLQGGGVGPAPGTVEFNGRYFRPHALPGCLVRNVETERFTTATRSAVDMGRDLPDWERLKNAAQSGPLVLHVAEGASRRMADEFRAISNSGLLTSNLVVVHGVGLDKSHFDEMAKVGAKLVWSPLSNFLLYGKTADVKAAKAAGVAISLAPDWAPSGSKSVLGELKVADLVNRHALKGLFSDQELVRMATRQPAASLGWEGLAGQIIPGAVADLLIVDARHSDAYRNLIESTEREVRATLVRGQALYGDSTLLQALRGSVANLEAMDELMPRQKSLAAVCSAEDPTYRDIRGRLEAALAFDGTFALARMGGERVAGELAKCGGEAVPTVPATATNATRMLQCRFGLPFEETPLMRLTAAGDPEYWTRLKANPNLPDYLKQLADYYR